jgi:flagellar biosynthesis/type III secretory pathway protein FliH
MATILLKLARPVKSIRVCDASAAALNAEQMVLLDDLKKQKILYQQACQSVLAISDKFKENYETIFAQRNEEIARLSVEIARKVLMRVVQDGDYEIENIIKEILQNAPSQNDLVVHLNPKDLAAIQQIGTEAFAGVTFVPDNNIGQAECVLESPKGIIKSLIDEHLEQIGKALIKAG